LELGIIQTIGLVMSEKKIYEKTTDARVMAKAHSHDHLGQDSKQQETKFLASWNFWLFFGNR
jgi:hypothetical protein